MENQNKKAPKSGSERKLSLLDRKRRSDFRALKERGKIKTEQFDREQLEQLGNHLLILCDGFLKSGRVLTNTEMLVVIDAENLLKVIDLLLSETTDYGHFYDLIKKSSF